MENKKIIETIKDILFLLELKGENAFRLQAYRKAIRVLESQELSIADLVKENKVQQLQGIGKGMAALLEEIISTSGRPQILLDLKKEIPREVRRFRRLDGLGPQKIRVLWQEEGIDTWVKLKNFIDTRKILSIKGFGPKNVARLQKSLAFLEEQGAYHLLNKIESYQKEWEEHLLNQGVFYSPTGTIRRGDILIEQLEFLTLFSYKEDILKIANLLDYQLTAEDSTFLKFYREDYLLDVIFYFTTEGDFYWKLHQTTGNVEYLDSFVAFLQEKNKSPQDFIKIENEKEIYARLNLPYVYPEWRERKFDFKEFASQTILPYIEKEDVRGLFHSHTTYSDGKMQLEELIKLAIAKGYQFIGISDHSQSAYYAGGLKEDKLRAQKEEVEHLQQKYPDFRIFWGIESDILLDGSLDYPAEILQEFDFVIGSIHSNLKQSGEEMTERLLNALDNPYLTFLGHPTGRLLTMREGGDLDYGRLLDKLAATGKGVEINCNPYRLDIDWRYLSEAKKRGIKIYLSPDIHRKEDIEYIKYGIKMAQKGFLGKEDIPNCWSAEEVDRLWREKK